MHGCKGSAGEGLLRCHTRAKHSANSRCFEHLGPFQSCGGHTWRIALEGALVEVIAHTQYSLQQLDEQLAGLHLLAGLLQQGQLLPHL